MCKAEIIIKINDNEVETSLTAKNIPAKPLMRGLAEVVFSIGEKTDFRYLAYFYDFLDELGNEYVASLGL